MRNELDALRKELAERLEKDPRKVANLRMQLREFNATSAQYEVRAMLWHPPPCSPPPLLGTSLATIPCYHPLLTWHPSRPCSARGPT